MLNAILEHIRQFQVVHYLVVFMAIALQIQVTVFANGDYLGLRVGLADIFLPFVGLFVLFSLVRKKSKWPEWSVRYMMFWLVALFFVMSLSLLNGYNVNGALSSWAFINKYIGFFLLLANLMLGGWIVTNARDAHYTLSLFATVFTGFFVLTMFMSMVTLFAQYLISYDLWLPQHSWDGFMANRNAFMIIFVLSFTLIIWSYVDRRTIIPIWVKSLFWLCLPIFFVFNDSRAGWLASIVLLLIFFSKNFALRTKSIVPFFLIGMIIANASFYVTSKPAVLQGKQMARLISVATSQDNEVEYFGDQKRYIAVEDGLELYKQHNPIIGAGLGSYKHFQVEKRGEFIDVMDFTGLWLLVETGALGLLVFSLFFIVSARALYQTGFQGGNYSYHRAMFVFLILFASISVLHELMYTRVLWFAMGLALVPPIRSKINLT